MIELRFKPCPFPNDHGGVCGCEIVYVDSGTKTHAGRIVCQHCDRMRKWLSREQFETIMAFQDEIKRLFPMELPVLTNQSLTVGAKTVTFQPKENSGSLFKNEQKSGNQPDYRGDANISGVVCKISGWVKEKKDGGKFLSLAFTPKEDGAGL